MNIPRPDRVYKGFATVEPSLNPIPSNRVPTQEDMMMDGAKEAKLPKKLYKFCAFNARCLDLLNRERIYYSDPTTFNDPLDCNPTINGDLSTDDLVRLCLIWNPSKRDETSVGKPQLQGEGPDLDEVGNAFYRVDLINELNRLLRRELGLSGVLSLTARWDSPLMWSHYADQHRGVCIEYDTTLLEHPNLRAVRYGASRSINASDLFRWKVEESSEAEVRVWETYFFAKASDWSYEKEWRYIYPSHGEDCATIKAVGIYFGVRCPPIVRSIFLHILPKGSTFREVFPRRESFKLESRFLDPSEEIAMAQGSSAYLDFAEQMKAANDVQE